MITASGVPWRMRATWLPDLSRTAPAGLCPSGCRWCSGWPGGGWRLPRARRCAAFSSSWRGARISTSWRLRMQLAQAARNTTLSAHQQQHRAHAQAQRGGCAHLAQALCLAKSSCGGERTDRSFAVDFVDFWFADSRSQTTYTAPAPGAWRPGPEPLRAACRGRPATHSSRLECGPRMAVNTLTDCSVSYPGLHPPGHTCWRAGCFPALRWSTCR